METIFKVTSQLIASVLPAVYCALFLLWRYQDKLSTIKVPNDLFGESGKYVVLLTLSAIFGVLVYHVHRGIFHRAVWFIQKRLYGIPQYEFHRQMCCDLGIEGPVKERIGISQACLFQTQIEEPEAYRNSTAAFNQGSHLLYVNSLTLMILALHELFVRQWVLALVFGIAVCFSMGVALAYDRLTDYREAVFLANRRKKYMEIVRNIQTYWGSVPHGGFLGRWERRVTPGNR